MSAQDRKKIQNREEAPAADSTPEAPRTARAARVKVDRRVRILRTFSVGSVVLFIAIAVVVNLLFQSLLGDALKWDSTPTAQYKLDATTTKILDGLQSDVRVVCLFSRDSWGTLYSSFLSSNSVSNTGAHVGEVPILLDEYVKASGGRIKVEYVDPVKVPGIVKDLDPDGTLGLTSAGNGTIVVTDPTTKKSKLLGMTSYYSFSFDQSSYSYVNTGMTAEQSFSGAIRFVAATDTPVVYFVSGNGEADYAKSYSTFAHILQNNNFETKSLDIRTVTEIPSDAAMLAFIDPTLDISPVQRDVMDAYMKKGGRVLLLAGYGTTTFPEFNAFLADYGIEVSNDRVREADTTLRLGGDPYNFQAVVPTSDITTQAYNLVLGTPRRIAKLQSTLSWLTTSTVLTTSSTGISEADGDVNAPSEQGTQILGIAAENKGWMIDDIKSAKVVVLGSTTLISDTSLTMLGVQESWNNQKFMYYAMEWLTDASANSLYIAAKSLPSYNLTAGDGTSRLLAAVVVVFLIPVGLLIAAFVVFRRRRHM